MSSALKAVEVTGAVDAEGRLSLDRPLAGIGPGRVRAEILVTDELSKDEVEWLAAAERSSAFDFLSDPAEDVYSLDDGRALEDHR